jgi:hypothetical protein
MTGKTILDIFRPTPKPLIATPTPKPPVVASLDIRKPNEQEVRTITNVWDLAQPTGCKFINTSTVPKYCNARIDPLTDYTWGFAWCANTEAQLRDELASLSVTYQVEKEILNPNKFTQFIELNEQNKLCVRNRTVINIPKSAKNYSLKLSIVLHKNTYEAGDIYIAGRHTLNLNLYPN